MEKEWPGAVDHIPRAAGRICLHPWGQSVLFEGSRGGFWEWQGPKDGWVRIKASDLA